MALPYAFGYARKTKDRGPKCFIMAYACGLNREGRPDREAQARLDKALEIAKEKRRSFDVFIFLGAGMPERTEKYGVASLAAASASYLEEKGWPKSQIVVEPVGYNTVVETRAFRDCLRLVRLANMRADEMEVHVVSSWVHAPRVWIVAHLLLGWSVHVHASRTGFRAKKMWYYLAYEIAALPQSIVRAVRTR